MPRRPRVHVPNGMYHVIHSSSGRRPIFVELDDYLEFERIFSQTLEQYDARVYAYCWLPGTIQFVLQLGSAPLSNIMRSLVSRYVQRYLRGHKPLFRDRYQATLFDPDYLFEFIRHVHRALLPQGQADIPENFLWSSHGAYLGHSCAPWLATAMALRSLSPNPDHAIERYREFMRQDGSASCVDGLHFGKRHDPRIVGGPLFLCSLPRHLQIHRGTMTLRGVIRAVLLQQGLTHAELFSRSSERRVVLARALIAFHATERGIATYSEVMRVLGRTGLKKAVQRLSTPDSPHATLFDVRALYNPGPLLPVPMRDVRMRAPTTRFLDAEPVVETE